MTTTATPHPAPAAHLSREHMDVVIVGHVDHGKSTVIGRLMADTDSLPQGKLEQVKAMCAAKARPFEYAFLLDALKNEQSQGITIDTARCFFKTARRNYIIHDAPGHIEFLKNMVTGAACAEAALLVIDAEEGIQENSRRHGYIVSMLGIRQLAVLVNKMDLVDYREEVFGRIRREYTEFLARLGVHPQAFLPISARQGVNMTERAEELAWYDGPTVLEQVDAFEKGTESLTQPFRMPVQDVYKFTAQGDDRRIVAGTITTGSVGVGEEVVFLPSGKSSTVKSIEGFSAAPRERIGAGAAAGFTLETQVYIKPGDIMFRRADAPPLVGRRFRANVFWMGRAPLVKGKQYKLKLGGAAVAAELVEILNVIDASELDAGQSKLQVERHDVAECVLETLRPLAFDLASQLQPTGRFVIVDDYEIAGAGTVLAALEERESHEAEQLRRREQSWERGLVTAAERQVRDGNAGRLVVLHGPEGCGKREVARQLERSLFARGHNVYYLGIANYFKELDHDVHVRGLDREQHLGRLGELARVLTDAGVLLITTLTDADDDDLERLRLLSGAGELFVVNLGPGEFSRVVPAVQLPYQPEVTAALGAITEKLAASGIVRG